jgi:hypothetical protein
MPDAKYPPRARFGLKRTRRHFEQLSALTTAAAVIPLIVAALAALC